MGSRPRLLSQLRAIVAPGRHPSQGERHPVGAGRRNLRDLSPHAGYLADDAPPPASIRLQLNALQSLCRQTIAARLAMITIGTPFAMANTPDGTPRYAVLATAVLAITASYAILRDWDRVAPRLLAHPTLMALDLLLVAALLATASPASPLAYATVCTPLLSGLLYGWRGAGALTGLQLVFLLVVFRGWEHHPGAGVSTLLIAGFCAATGVIGVTLRNLMFRFGAAGQALSEANSRLAVAEAVESERARLAREMHDSVAKTLHGLALAADALAASADTCDPAVLKRQATMVAGAARRAATESRDLLSDLRRHTDFTATHLDLATELASRVRDFTCRTHTPTELKRPETPLPPLPYTTAHQILAIVAEALENTHRHASATHVTIELDVTGEEFDLSVRDNGVGLPAELTRQAGAPDRAPPDREDLAPETLEHLAKSGHFGLLGMAERAASLGGRIRLGRSPRGGAEVHLNVPLPAHLPHAPQEEAAHA